MNQPAQAHNASDREQVEAKAKKAERRDQRVANGLKQILANADTRAWLWWLLDEMGPFQETFTGNSTTFYNAGRQAIGKRLVSQLLEKFPDEYFTMVKEAKHA